MAKVTQLAHEIAMSHQPNALGAVEQCDVYPNSRNIIPGRVVFTIDFRSPDFEIQGDMEERLRTGTADIAEELGLEEVETVGHFDPVTFDEGCVDAVRRAAERLGTATNIVARQGTTPAGSTAWRRRPWSCVPASTG